MNISRFTRLRFLVLLGLLIYGGIKWSQAAQSQYCALPPGLVTFSLGTNAGGYTPVVLSGVPAGYSISNGVHTGWCVQYDIFIESGFSYNAALYDTYDSLPIHLQNFPWDKVNYILNHKQGRIEDVQYAIWSVLGQAPFQPQTTEAEALVRDVNDHGAGFVPTNGQIVAVIVQPVQGVQRLILETVWDERCRDTIAPSVMIWEPEANTIFRQSQTVAINAGADDNVGVIRVDFYDGQTLKATFSSPPYVYNWSFTEADNGAHNWTARAYDFAGNNTLSAVVPLTVSIDVVPPTVSIASPASETRYSNDQTVSISAVATDNFGVTKVEFYDRGVLRETVTTAPYIINWTVTAAENGTHNWTARAYDAAGNSSVSTVVALDVAIDIVPPVVFFASPSAPQTYTMPQTVPLTANAVDNFGVTRVEFYDTGVLRGTASAAPFSFPWAFTGADNGLHRWTAVAYDAAGHSTASTELPLTVNIDTTAPTVTILTPYPEACLTNQVITIQGTATDNDEVARVECQVEDGPFEVVNGTLNWSASMTVTPGRHTIRIRSIDRTGNESIVAVRSFTYFATSRLRVIKNGKGAIAPDLDNQDLEIGKSYSMTATPEPGYEFSDWSGGAASASEQITFAMQSNLVLEVNFKVKSFQSEKAGYCGLFYEANAAHPNSSGDFVLKTSPRGTYSGRLRLGDARFGFSGRISEEGLATNSVSRKGIDLTIELQFYSVDGEDFVRGRVLNGTWEAMLLGYRQVFDGKHPAPFAGRYTLSIPGSMDASTSPGGDGFATLKINNSGKLSLKGMLADGTVFTQRVPLSQNGVFPVYAPLYGGNGSVLSWLTLTNLPTEDITGLLSWMKMASPGDQYYPSGFTNVVDVTGSIYMPPAKGERVLNISDAILTLFQGNLPAPIVEHLTLDSRNKIDGSNNVRLKSVLSTGLMKGKVIDPASGKKIKVQGVVLQKQNIGAGSFLGDDQSGGFRFESAP